MQAEKVAQSKQQFSKKEVINCKYTQKLLFMVLGLFMLVIPLLLIGISIPALADTLTFHDPNGDGFKAAWTESICTGFFTVTITYTIVNEEMEEPYTVDWKEVPFRVTIGSYGVRSSSIQSYKSCPEKNGSVDWIDQGNVNPERGTQTFPAPLQYFGWVILDSLKDLLSNTNNKPEIESVLYDGNNQVMVKFRSATTPLNLNDPEGSHWRYDYEIINYTHVAHEFIVSAVESGFNGTVGANSSVTKTIYGLKPYMVRVGSVRLSSDEEIFPATAFNPLPIANPGNINIATGYNTFWILTTAICLMLAGGYLIFRRKRKFASSRIQDKQ